MEYEVMELLHKHIVGIVDRTSNGAPDMQQKIGGLWKRLYGDGMLGQIPNRTGEAIYGLYTNYASDAVGEYDVVAGAEVSAVADALEEIDLCAVKIPDGKYARFTIKTDMQGTGLEAAWQEIWDTKLNRAYTVDFEEYMPSDDNGDTKIHIYVALNE